MASGNEAQGNSVDVLSNENYPTASFALSCFISSAAGQIAVRYNYNRVEKSNRHDLHKLQVDV